MGCGSSSNSNTNSPDPSNKGINQEAVGGVKKSAWNHPEYSDPNEGFYRGTYLIQDDLSYMLELYLSCTNLPDLDNLSKTDPMCIVYELHQKSNEWIERGRTEIIDDTLNPEFILTIKILYKFEEKQKLLIRVIDIDDKSNQDDYKKQELVGSGELFISDIIRTRDQTRKIEIQHPKRKNNGQIIIWGEQVEPNQASTLVALGVSAQVLNTKYFYKLFRSKQEDGGDMIPIFRSEVRRGTNFEWNNARVLGSVLCRNDFGRAIQIQILEWMQNGNHKVLTEELVLLPGLQANPKILNFSKGHITMVPYRIEREYTFLEYLRGGLQISLSIAIDFTRSNGEPNEASSLHFYDLNKNEYLQAIHAVGSVLEPYDYDGLIPVLGFGAKFEGTTNHCFYLSPPEGVPGIPAVYEIYKNFLPTAVLSGPTYFTQILKNIVNQGKEMKDHNPNGYLVFMLMTDGQYVDEDSTIDMIVEASNLPISIIIVGVGNEDFSLMDQLDADEKPLRSSKGEYMSRDIVQFVPFSKFKHDPQMLAAHTLAEIPRQCVLYFNRMGISPAPHN